MNTFIHSGENNYENDGDNSVIPNDWFSVMHNSEFDDSEQDVSRHCPTVGEYLRGL